MIRTSKGLLTVALCVALVSCKGTSVTNAAAAAELTAATADFDKGQLDDALAHAQKAITLAPYWAKAHFAAAKTADEVCVRNAEPRPDERMCGLAIQEYRNTLQLDPRNVTALDNLADVLYNLHGKDEAEPHYRAAITIDANDPTAMCALAAFAWQRSWPDVARAKNDLHLRFEDPLIHSPACDEARTRNKARVDEGIALATKALQLRRTDTDLMGHLTVLYNTRAELQCGDAAAYASDKSAAETWLRTGQHTTYAEGVRLRCPSGPPPPPPDE